jgi:hypothetical protein
VSAVDGTVRRRREVVVSRYRVAAVRGTRSSSSVEPVTGFRAYAAAASRVESTEGVVETRKAGLARGGLHLMVRPTDFSKNVRVLPAELRRRGPEPTTKA